MKKLMILTTLMMFVLAFSVYGEYIIESDFPPIYYKEGSLESGADADTVDIIKDYFDGFVNGEFARYYYNDFNDDGFVSVVEFSEYITFNDFEDNFFDPIVIAQDMDYDYDSVNNLGIPGAQILFLEEEIEDNIIATWTSEGIFVYVYFKNGSILYEENAYEDLLETYLERYPSTLRFEANYSCSDSDANLAYPDGINYYEKGITSAGSSFEGEGFGGGSGGAISDSCTGNILNEFFCDPDFDEIIDYQYACPHGCSDGVCLTGSGCCIEDGRCYATSSVKSEDVCSGSWHKGSCDLNDRCHSVKECFPGDTIVCEDGGINRDQEGVRTCTLENVYGPCTVTDTAYLNSIDGDGDRDPDATDCAPDDKTRHSRNNCVPEVLAPPKGIGGLVILWIFRILLLAILIFIVIELWKKGGKKPKKHKKHHKRKK